jgi:hypothetical protein
MVRQLAVAPFTAWRRRTKKRGRDSVVRQAGREREMESALVRSVRYQVLLMEQHFFFVSRLQFNRRTLTLEGLVKSAY